ncbi:MAG: HAD-IA family hydrolase [Microcystis aeruginosa W13-15]|nr:HAD-IA family hydrolase [Microcystis aeruginosa W13-15]
MRKNYKALIFDYDDTLVQTREIRYRTIKRIYNEVLKDNISDNEIDSAWGLPAEEFLLKIFGKFSNDINSLWEIYNNYKKFDQNRPHENAFKFIEKYYDIIRFGILTSSSYKVVTNELYEMKVDQNLFFNIQGAEHTDVHKPNPEVFLPIFKLLSESRIEKSEILYIGDSPADFHSSTKFGLNFIGIAHDERHLRFFKQQNINFVKNFHELELLLNP